MKSRWALVVVFFLALGLTYWVNTKVPRAFVPEEDQGYFLTIVQAPAGSSLQYTGAVAREAEKILMAEPDILGVFSVMGFSFSGAAPNQGIVFASLKPFDERKGAEPLRGGGRRPRAAQAAVDSRGDHRVDRAGVDSGSQPFRRVRVPGARPDRHGHQYAGRRGVRRHGRRRQVAAAAGRLHPVHRERSAAARQHRSAARAGRRAAARRDHERDADVPGVVLRERLPVQQPRLPRLRAGRQAVPREPAEHQADVRALADRADGPARQRRDDQGDGGAAGHRALQSLPLGDAERIGQAGRQLRRRAEGDGADRRPRRCRRA